ncbi:hypothetical protein HK102_000213 [Quaeritorhiza haematococci]|nr:hypothetical protein HK102_000213 [Quaeritorhiza haematococci]
MNMQHQAASTEPGPSHRMRINPSVMRNLLLSSSSPIPSTSSPDAVQSSATTPSSATSGAQQNLFPRVNEPARFFDQQWPQLSELVRIILSVEAQKVTPLHSLSHEELYRMVYQICWHGHRRKLYEALVKLIEQELTHQHAALESISDVSQWWEAFGLSCINGHAAIERLSSVFAYLDRSYIKYELKKDLRQIVQSNVQKLLVEASELKLATTLKMLAENALTVDAGQVTTLLTTLYSLNEGNVYFRPDLFQQCVPNLQQQQQQQPAPEQDGQRNLAWGDVLSRYRRLETMVELAQIKQQQAESGHEGQGGAGFEINLLKRDLEGQYGQVEGSTMKRQAMMTTDN